MPIYIAERRGGERGGGGREREGEGEREREEKKSRIIPPLNCTRSSVTCEKNSTREKYSR